MGSEIATGPKGEPQHIVEFFTKMGIPVEIVNAKEQFFTALKGLADPEEKREAITQSFYRDVSVIL